MKRIVDLEDFILTHIVRPFQYTGNFGEETVKTLWCDINEFIVVAKLKPEWWELVLRRLSRIDFYFAYWLHNIPIVQFILSEIKRIKHKEILGVANEKSEFIRVCTTEAAKQVCAEVKIKPCECQDKSEDVFALGRECWCKNAT